ncbi:erythroblast NAD(P)(+)--arginine ADP-ribosyltransferase isoform 1-T1 [Synchiropus picturatus]
MCDLFCNFSSDTRMKETVRISKMTWSLVAVVLLLTATVDRVAAVKQMDLSPHAVDDLYQGCREKAMKKFISSGLLEKELQANQDFFTAWNTSLAKPIPGGLKEHAAALWAYFHVDKKFTKRFNDAVEKLGVNSSVYQQDFQFKSIHFLLMDAIHLLKPKTCKNVYMISDSQVRAKTGSKVRFGRFTVVRTDLSMKEDIGDDVYFNITTCFSASLQDICPTCGDDALISPTEEFTAAEEIVDEETHVVLQHSKLTATHNCYFTSGAAVEVSTLWLLSLLLAAQLLNST